MEFVNTYIVDGNAGDLEGWTPESLAAALEKPLGDLGIAVESTPHAHGGGGLVDCDDDVLVNEIDRLVERVIQE